MFGSPERGKEVESVHWGNGEVGGGEIGIQNMAEKWGILRLLSSSV